MDKQKRAVIAIPIIIIALVSITFIQREYYEKPTLKAIKENKAFTDGWITRVLHNSNRGPAQETLYYIFTVKGKQYEDEKTVEDDGIHDMHELYYNKHFPVVYSSSQVDKHDLLLNAADSEKYDVH
ncbi:MAG: hypothetical protein JSS96_12030 [Bacteroidetes bacterium]|nr:hypothetical protein [Bacteroidota bacterium]